MKKIIRGITDIIIIIVLLTKTIGSIVFDIMEHIIYKNIGKVVIVITLLFFGVLLLIN